MREELTPLRFLERAREAHPNKLAIVDEDTRLTYAQFAEHATRLANALKAEGIEPGERVAYLCSNRAELLIAHYAVPLIGAVLVAINTRLSSGEIDYICEHSGAKLLVVEDSLLSSLGPHWTGPPLVVIEPSVPSRATRSYEELLAAGSDDELPWQVDDEERTITINYTSGTTGRPKGVMYTHRGAYLNALGELLHSEHSARSVYLWTLPMFHCNGWCTTWAITAIAGTHVCLRAVVADRIWELIDTEGVTHLNGAPTVLNIIAEASRAHPLTKPLTVTTAGAAPSPSTIARLEGLGARVIHVYGLTETYGPYSICEPQFEWEELTVEDRAKLLARQGLGMVQADRLRVVDDEMVDVPADGETMGELVMRGNNVMAGYFRDDEATEAAFKGGWFHSGDLGVMHPDGYVQLLDRAKDIVISGGENISTIEVESVLSGHPAVADVAVIAVPSERWGERPKAYVVRRPDSETTAAELIEYVRSQLAHFKSPDAVEFVAALPRTSTGKVQKYELRKQAASAGGAATSGASAAGAQES